MSGPTPQWIDNHCHLEPGPDGDEQLARAEQAGVRCVVDVGTDLESSQAAIAKAARHPGRVFATVGLHPHDASCGTEGLDDLLGAPGVVAVGEAGLDYHYDHSPRPVQRDVFATQIGFAHQHQLPLVIHTREAWDDTFTILATEGTPARTVFHCFTGGPDEATEALRRGALISFSGIITFKTATDVRAAARCCPLDRVMVETDSPYLAPVPHRGEKNEPANVGLVGTALAAELDHAVDVVAETVWATTERFYGLAAGDDAPG